MPKLKEPRKVTWVTDSGKQSRMCFTHEDIAEAQRRANIEGQTAKVQVASGAAFSTAKTSKKPKPNRRPVHSR